jgi:hypothetical protein
MPIRLGSGHIASPRVFNFFDLIPEPKGYQYPFGFKVRS